MVMARATGRSRRWLVGAMTGAAVLALQPGVAAADAEPELQVEREELQAAMDCPDTFADEGRNPVLLVQGTGPTPRENFGWNLLPQLTADGFDVCTVELPMRALGDIQVAAEYVVHGLREVHERSGQRVDVAGHSQGGLEPRWALAWWPSTRELLGDLVTYASPHHGTVVTDVACAASHCWPAVHQMRPGSAFLEALHAQEDLSGLSVTSLGSVMDELVQPPTTIDLEGASNIILQDVCPGRPVTHLSIVADAVAYDLMLDAFEHEGPADPGRLADDACLQTMIEEAGPHDLLTIDSLLGYTDGSSFDPSIPQSLFTDEEPELAPYAAAAQEDDAPAADEETHPADEGEDDEGSDGAGTGTSPEAEGSAGGEIVAAGTAADAPSTVTTASALPATGGAAAGVGAALLALAALARPRATASVRSVR
jgi:triacylglycerol lipase